jgi:hypothetical protein
VGATVGLLSDCRTVGVLSDCCRSANFPSQTHSSVMPFSHVANVPPCIAANSSAVIVDGNLPRGTRSARDGGGAEGTAVCVQMRVSRHRSKTSVGEFELLLSLGPRPVREGPGTRLGALMATHGALQHPHATSRHFNHLADL